jgi:hypothetical protein
MFPLKISDNGDMDILRVNIGNGVLSTVRDEGGVVVDNVDKISDNSILQLSSGIADQERNGDITPLSIYTTGNYIPDTTTKDSSIWVNYNNTEESNDKTSSGITFGGRNYGNVHIPRARVSATPVIDQGLVNGKISIDAFRPINTDVISTYQQNRYETGVDIIRGTPAVLRGIGFIADLSAIQYNQERFVVMSRSGTTNQTYVTSDGVNWVDRRTIQGSYDWSSITFGLGLYVAVSSIIATSSDGTVWTERSSPSPFQYKGVTFGNGRFVAVATNGIVYSNNGIVWNNSLSFSLREYTAVTFGNG